MIDFANICQNIPAELQALPQWITWRAEDREGKPTKIPCDCRGIPCSVTDPRAYGTFADALECVRQNGASGIGFVFAESDPYCGIDIDDCHDPETSSFDSWAFDEIIALDGYTELSPSGTGVHVIIKARPPEGKGRKKGSRECYFSGRFFTVTGNAFLNISIPIGERQEQLDKWHAQHFAEQPQATRKTWSHPTTASDSELFRRIEASKQGDKFARLWRGDTSDYNGDDSAADLALCSLLYWWTGGDSDRVDKLFRQSGLMRSKWDATRGQTTYGGLTLARAASQSSVYQSDSGGSAPIATFAPATPVGGATVAANPKRIYRWLDELEPPKIVDNWVWKGYLARNSITLMSAYWKAGKTTLLTHLLRECQTGGELFGQQVDPTTVLYITEEHERLWYDRREKLGLDKARRTTGIITQPFKSRPSMVQWAQLIEQVADCVKNEGFGLVVLDTLGKLWPVKEENDASGVEEALMPLWRIADAGASVLLVHHMRKSGGQEFTASRGSGSLPSFVDLILEFERVNKDSKTCAKRRITANGRYDETPRERSAELRNDRYVVIDSGEEDNPQKANEYSKEKAILDIIRQKTESGEGIGTTDLRNALRERGVQIRDIDASAIILRLYKEGTLGYKGKIGSKTNPRKWVLGSAIPVPALGLNGNGHNIGSGKTTELDIGNHEDAGAEYDAYNAAQRELEADFFGYQSGENDE